jgi:hypothetical protein
VAELAVCLVLIDTLGERWALRAGWRTQPRRPFRARAFEGGKAVPARYKGLPSSGAINECNGATTTAQVSAHCDVEMKSHGRHSL